MDIAPVSSTPTTVSAGTSILKKALDAQSQAAMILIESIAQTPTVSAANLPPNLGQNINTTA